MQANSWNLYPHLGVEAASKLLFASLLRVTYESSKELNWPQTTLLKGPWPAGSGSCKKFLKNGDRREKKIWLWKDIWYWYPPRAPDNIGGLWGGSRGRWFLPNHVVPDVSLHGKFKAFFLCSLESSKISNWLLVVIYVKVMESYYNIIPVDWKPHNVHGW